MMGVEVLVPLIVFSTVAIIFWSAFKYGAVKREATLNTIRAVVEKTGEASPALIESIGAELHRRNEDFRKGLLLMAIAAAIVGMGLIVSRHVSEVLLGLALFPGLVGAVYIVFHFMNSDRNAT